MAGIKKWVKVNFWMFKENSGFAQSVPPAVAGRVL